MDELRNAIWDYLYVSKSSREIDEITRDVHQDSEAVRAAVSHEWFKVEGNAVMIAYDKSDTMKLN